MVFKEQPGLCDGLKEMTTKMYHMLLVIFGHNFFPTLAHPEHPPHNILDKLVLSATHSKKEHIRKIDSLTVHPIFPIDELILKFNS